MEVLVDTNVLLRLLQPLHPQCAMASAAIAKLRAQRANLFIATQNLVEFWVVATRPVTQNGLGMSPLKAAAEVQTLLGLFSLLEGRTGVAAMWEKLVSTHLISGKLAHDAHLVAVMRGYAVNDILTFNGRDFRRFQGIVVVDPAEQF